MLPSYNSKAIVSLQIVCQVVLLPFFTGNLHCCKSGCSAPFLQQWGHSQLTLLIACSNFIPIYPNLFEFCRIFEWIWVKREGMWKVELCVSAIIPTCNAACILDISYLYYLYRIDQETPNKYPCIWYSSLIMTKADFNDKVTHFFFSYLIDRHIQYMWNHHTSPLLTIDVGISQSSILFLILSTIYIVSLLKFFEKRINNLSIPILVSLFSFVDNGLFVF